MGSSIGRSAEAASGLSAVGITFGGDVLFDEADNDLTSAPAGKWQISEARLDGRTLAFRIRIAPPRQTLEVESGPAVLFTGMLVSGGRGDVGLEAPVHEQATTAVEACPDDFCTYETEVRIDTDDVLPAIDRLVAAGSTSGGSISVNLTFVRTFGLGTWLQVLPLTLPEYPALQSHGTFGDIDPAEGEILPYGLFPRQEATLPYVGSVEEERLHLADETHPIPMAPAFLHAAIDSACTYPRSLAVQTEAGDRVLEWPLAPGMRVVDVGFALPIGVPVGLTLRGHGGEVSRGAAEVVSDGEPISIDARLTCAGPPERQISVTTTSLAVPTPSQARPTPATPTEASVPATPEPTGASTPQPNAVAEAVLAVAVLVLVLMAAIGLGIAALRRRRLRGA